MLEWLIEGESGSFCPLLPWAMTRFLQLECYSFGVVLSESREMGHMIFFRFY